MTLVQSIFVDKGEYGLEKNCAHCLDTNLAMSSESLYNYVFNRSALSVSVLL